MSSKGMESYLDESGITQEDMCVMAGFAGGYRQWRALGTGWDKLIKELPQMDFHAKTFFAKDESGMRVGPYKNWTNGKAKAFLDALIDAIGLANLHPFGAAVDFAAFNRRTLDERIFLTGGLNSLGMTEWGELRCGALLRWTAEGGCPHVVLCLACQFNIL